MTPREILFWKSYKNCLSIKFFSQSKCYEERKKIILKNRRGVRINLFFCWKTNWNDFGSRDQVALHGIKARCEISCINYRQEKKKKKKKLKVGKNILLDRPTHFEQNKILWWYILLFLPFEWLLRSWGDIKSHFKTSFKRFNDKIVFIT